MNSEPQIHTYRCSFCKTIATAAIKTSRPPIKCVLCFRIMAFMWSDPVTTDVQRARIAKGIVFGSDSDFIANAVKPIPCDTCKTKVPKNTMVHLTGVGRFCGDDCAQAGVMKHRAYMERRREEENEQATAWRRVYTPKEHKAS